MENKFLLTGAGFSHNFNFPLARQVWGMIFNSTLIHANNNIRKLLLKSFNYEKIYSEIANEKKYEKNREAFFKIIENIFYEYFEKICRKVIYQNEITGVCFQDLREFIKLFSVSQFGSGLIFTTNQDLFLERLFLADDNPGMIVSPYIGNCLWNYNIKKNQIGLNLPIKQAYSYGLQNDEKWLPTQDTLIEKKSKLDLSRKQDLPFYIKLHGSIGWYKKGQENIPLVMGTSKTQIIANEPVFTEYMDLFQKSLLSENTSLLIIGYSFSDQHINKIIIDGIKNAQLRVHIVNPLPIDKFKENLIKFMGHKKADILYKKGIFGYYENTLKDFFPIEPKGKEGYAHKANPYEILKSNFFI